MRYLTQFNTLRQETEISVIETLLRKGWVEIFVPDYNPETQIVEFDPSIQNFKIIDIPQEQINHRKLEEKISEGFLVQPENFILGLQESDRNAFNQMLSLIKEALDLGMITNDSLQVIADINRVKHTVTTLRFRQIMVLYGMYYKSLWDNFSL